jgi:hypothetical protein
MPLEGRFPTLPIFLTRDFSPNGAAASPSVAVGNWTMINWSLIISGGSSEVRHVFQAGHASSTLVAALDRPLSFRDLGF